MLHSQPFRQGSLTCRPRVGLAPGKSSHLCPIGLNKGWLQPSRHANAQQRRLPLVQSPEVSKLGHAVLKHRGAPCCGGNKALAVALKV